jgi:hypothetical protein
MRIGRLQVGRLHRAHWWQGFRLEWSYTRPGDRFPNLRCRFISVEIQW